MKNVKTCNFEMNHMLSVSRLKNIIEIYNTRTRPF